MDDSVFFKNKTVLQDLLSENSEVGVILGNNHTIDKMAAALSLYLSLRAFSLNAQIVSKKEPIVELSSLFGVDRVKTHFEGKVQELVISIPNREGEIERVTSTSEEDKLNIRIIGGEGGVTFRREDLEFIYKGSTPTLVFTIGISMPEEIGGLVDSSSSIKIVNIDNNSANSLFGEIVFVDSAFSSLSEIVAQVIKENNLPIDQDIAQNLMSGIEFATDNFSSHKTSFYAFEAGGFLLRHGVKRHRKVEETQRRVDLMEGISLYSGSKPFQQHTQPKQKIITQQNPRREDNDLAAQKEVHSGQGVPSDWLSPPKIFKSSKKQD